MCHSPGKGVCSEVGDLRVGKFKISHMGIRGESRENPVVLLSLFEDLVKLGYHGLLRQTLSAKTPLAVHSGARDQGCGRPGVICGFSFSVTWLGQTTTKVSLFTTRGAF